MEGRLIKSALAISNHSLLENPVALLEQGYTKLVNQLSFNAQLDYDQLRLLQVQIGLPATMF